MIEIKDNRIFLDNELIGYITFGRERWCIDIIDYRFPIRHIKHFNRDDVIFGLLSEVFSLEN